MSGPNDTTSSAYRFAIIGGGPRGCSALESLVASLAKLDRLPNITIRLFEETSHLGSGRVYATNQPNTNWLNSTERSLNLPSRIATSLGAHTVPSFPGYLEWAGSSTTPARHVRVDSFPPRSTVGRFLRERFESMSTGLIAAGLLTIVRERVDRVQWERNVCELHTQKGRVYCADQALLTVGHQPTYDDAQLRDWKRHAASNRSVTLHEHPYPVREVRLATKSRAETHVAIRGYGLAMIDATRAIAQRHGHFQIVDERSREQLYTLDEGVRLKIVPFSRDGLTCAAKPISASVDNRFAPTSDELETLRRNLSNHRTQASASDNGLIVSEISPIIARVFRQLDRKGPACFSDDTAASHVVSRWLRNAEVEHHSIMDRSMEPGKCLAAFIAMAIGDHDATLDYCAGQVWRHCHPTLCAALSYNALKHDALVAVIELNERLKRYAAGPPVESLQQLRALHDAGVLILDFLRDPSITCTPDGWRLSNDGADFTAPTMVNSVLDGPVLKAVSSPLIRNLLQDDLIEPVHDDFGVLTTDDAFVSCSDGDVAPPIALLGRLAKGTLFGVDSLPQCFGDQADSWAHAAVERMVRHLS